MLNLKRYQFLHYKDHTQDEYGNYSDIRNCDDGDWVKFEDIKHFLPTSSNYAAALEIYRDWMLAFNTTGADNFVSWCELQSTKPNTNPKSVDNKIEKETTLQRVTRIISNQFAFSDDEVKPTSSLKNDFGADSVDQIELIIEVENEFNIAIEDEEAEKLDTVQSVVDYIDKICK